VYRADLTFLVSNAEPGKAAVLGHAGRGRPNLRGARAGNRSRLPGAQASVQKAISIQLSMTSRFQAAAAKGHRRTGWTGPCRALRAADATTFEPGHQGILINFFADPEGNLSSTSSNDRPTPRCVRCLFPGNLVGNWPRMRTGSNLPRPDCWMGYLGQRSFPRRRCASETGRANSRRWSPTWRPGWSWSTSARVAFWESSAHRSSRCNQSHRRALR